MKASIKLSPWYYIQVPNPDLNLKLGRCLLYMHTAVYV